MKKNKQERKFQTQWTTNRKWLVYSDEENKMYCTLCLLLSFILIYFLSVSLVWALLHTGGSSLRLSDLSHDDWVSSFD
jgi:hypothetical protein